MNKNDLRKSLALKFVAFVVGCISITISAVCFLWGFLGRDLDWYFFHEGHFMNFNSMQYGSIGAGFLILFFMCTVYLVSAAGWHRGLDKPESIWSTIIPFDLLTAIYVGLGVGVIALFAVAMDALSPWEFNGSEWLRVYDNEYFQQCMLCGIATSVSICTLLYALLTDFAVRVKIHNLIKNTIIYWCIAKAIWLVKIVLKLILKILAAIKNTFAHFIRALTNINVLGFKGGVVLCALLVADIFFASLFHWEFEFFVIWTIFKSLFLLAAFIYLATILKRLNNGAIALAEGDLSHKVDSKHMYWEFKKHADALNLLGEGTTKAFEEKMRSEMFKTELITNVSHDIKTPLTSIINYSDLICSQESENEKITEYAEVLKRQSEKLKRLLEDLVEASKAQTGNLEVDLMPCDAGVFIMQALGEYEDRLNASNLTPVSKLPEKPVKIMADGRRMQRVIDNLMNNICKYSMVGSRVYLNLERVGDDAVMTFKNVSAESLNISAEELMERFVRGDKSRNTEGSGLGLSIARSFTELQGGKLDLSVDGDLFKVTLTFKAI